MPVVLLPNGSKYWDRVTSLRADRLAERSGVRVAHSDADVPRGAEGTRMTANSEALYGPASHLGQQRWHPAHRNNRLTVRRGLARSPCNQPGSTPLSYDMADGHCCGLVSHGHLRNGKGDDPQIVFGPVFTGVCCPAAVGCSEATRPIRPPSARTVSKLVSDSASPQTCGPARQRVDFVEQIVEDALVAARAGRRQIAEHHVRMRRPKVVAAP